MKHTKKIVALGLCLTMALSLAACGKPAGGTPTPSGSVPPTIAPAAGYEMLADNQTDIAKLTLGIDQTATALTVNGNSVTGEVYAYWLGNVASYYDMYSQYNAGAPLDFTQEISEGTTWNDQLKKIAIQNSTLFALVPEIAKEFKVELDEADLKTISDSRVSKIDAAGDLETYAYQLQSMGINDKTSLELEKVTALFSKVQEKAVAEMLEGKGIAPITDEAINAYVTENDLLTAKHILLLTKDMTTGEALDDAAKATAKATAEDILSQLNAAADPVALFDTLMNEHSEDSGLADNPDGYTFTANQMVPEFEQGTRDLEIGKISGIIESDYGYHIILRLSPVTDALKSEVATQEFNSYVNKMVEEATVVADPAVEKVVTGDFYKILADFQATLVDPSATPAPSATPEVPAPSATPEVPAPSASPEVPAPSATPAA